MIRATLYDGMTSRARDVLLSVTHEHLIVRPLNDDGPGERFSIATLRITTLSKKLPLVIETESGGRLEVSRDPSTETFISNLTRFSGTTHISDRSTLTTVGFLAAGLIVLVVAYRILLPVAARSLAPMIPRAVIESISQHALVQLDRSVLLESKMPNSDREKYRLLVNSLPMGESERSVLHIEYRSSPEIGPNAFALPDGTVIVLDELVHFAESNEELLGILAHEVGHVHHRHGAQMLIKGSVLALLASLWFGDVGSIAAGIPVLLLQNGYSRDSEWEADRYAVEVLKRAGVSPKSFASILERMEKSRGGSNTFVERYFSTHPGTEERIQYLKNS